MTPNPPATVLTSPTGDLGADLSSFRGIFELFGLVYFEVIGEEYSSVGIPTPVIVCVGISPLRIFVAFFSPFCFMNSSLIWFALLPKKSARSAFNVVEAGTLTVL